MGACTKSTLYCASCLGYAIPIKLDTFSPFALLQQFIGASLNEPHIDGKYDAAPAMYSMYTSINVASVSDEIR